VVARKFFFQKNLAKFSSSALGDTGIEAPVGNNVNFQTCSCGISYVHES
jgi:hypothetical protein